MPELVATPESTVQFIAELYLLVPVTFANIGGSGRCRVPLPGNRKRSGEKLIASHRQSSWLLLSWPQFSWPEMKSRLSPRLTSTVADSHQNAM
jgi:hypothetical protein